MLDINKIRQNPEEVRRGLLKKIDNIDFTELLEWDKECRASIAEVESLKAKRNKVSADIPNLKKEGKDVSNLVEEMKKIGDDIKVLDDKVGAFQTKIREFLEVLPNPADDDVVDGDKEQNQVIRSFGTKREFTFKPKDHVELATSLGLIDYKRAVKISGNGFWMYTGLGAQLEWALLNYFVKTHLKDGYEFILPPYILNYESGYTAGQFPKFKDDVFRIENSEKGQFLLPTAETPLANFYRDEVVPEEELPKKFFGYSACFRSEAGSYRASERGMIRGHQFNKIEMFIYCTPQDSEKMLEELVHKAENLVNGLGLTFQVSKLASRDCSSAMAKTIDIEIWIPSMNEFKEVSSASMCREYQAIRGNMRYKSKETGKNAYINTLHASGLATSRLIPAILEQFQQEDGSVVVPEPLREWVGCDIIKPRN